MSIIIAATWSSSLDLFSGWVVMVTLISAVACFIASLRKIHVTSVGQLLVIVGAPVLFITVLFSGAGMCVLLDGREFGFPIWARANPFASEFLATYIALGASYLIAREATHMPIRAVRIIGWIESAGFALLGAFELFLLVRKIYGG